MNCENNSPFYKLYILFSFFFFFGRNSGTPVWKWQNSNTFTDGFNLMMLIVCWYLFSLSTNNREFYRNWCVCAVVAIHRLRWYRKLPLAYELIISIQTWPFHFYAICSQQNLSSVSKHGRKIHKGIMEKTFSVAIYHNQCNIWMNTFNNLFF